MDGYEKNAARQFGELLEPHLERLFRFAFRLTHARDEAEDLFQDVLVKLYPRMDELAELDDPASWLCRVLYNHFIDNRRRYQRRRLVDVAEHQLPGESVASLPDGVIPIDQSVANNEALGRALAELSEEQRSIVLLHDAEGYKLAEIAEITEQPVGTVKSRLHRARARLREILREDGTFS